MHIITTTQELADFAAALRERPFVAVDTEFMREKTYWPILCLIQAAAEGLEAIIDPLADGIDLTPFHEVLADASVTKVFHAARQDVEIFFQMTGAAPNPLFDTQVAAMACGYGDQVGYEPLMRNLLNASIDKGSRFTDWARRPLTDKQLTYALSDVTYLREAYPIILEQLDDGGRHAWVAEEMQQLADASLYNTAPEDAWRRLKLRGVRPPELGPLIKVAAWREREAQRRNVPRARIAKDDAIYELARMRPKSAEDLSRARSTPKGFERSAQGAALLKAVAEGVAMEKADLPRIERNNNRPPPPSDVVELLKVLLKRQCEEYKVAPRLIASSSDLEELALNVNADIPAMNGWRREVFGDRAQALMEGRLAMRLVGKKLELVDL